MKDGLTEGQKREVIALIAQFGANKRGLVSSYQASPPMAKVQLMPPPPDGSPPVETGWIPVLSQWVGNGWGLVAPLVEGAQVFLGVEEGDGENFVVLGQYYSDEDVAPTGAANGEIILQHESGASFRLANDGSIALLAEKLTVAAPGGGNSTVSIAGTLSASVELYAAGKAVSPHTHLDPQGGSTGPMEG